MKMKACKNCGNLFPAKGRKTLCDDCKNYLSRAVMRPCRKCGALVYSAWIDNPKYKKD